MKWELRIALLMLVVFSVVDLVMDLPVFFRGGAGWYWIYRHMLSWAGGAAATLLFLTRSKPDKPEVT